MDPGIRALVAADGAALRDFRCAGFREPWADDVETVIREFLPYALEIGEAEGLGAWVDGQLVCLCAWSRVTGLPGAARIAVLATSVDGCRRQGWARRLKVAAIEALRQRGFVALLSSAHRDNEGIYRLNLSLGARVATDQANSDYLNFIIDLR